MQSRAADAAEADAGATGSFLQALFSSICSSGNDGDGGGARERAVGA